ncbi:MAG: hypothetical protein U0792_12405 [Gemmataceae bacterium]
MWFSFRRWLKLQSTGRKSVPVRKPLQLRCEQLDDRIVPAVITVQTNGDATGSLTAITGGFTAPTLRAAIDGANSMAGADTIQFATGVAGQTVIAALNDTTNPFAFGPTAFVITSDITIAGLSGSSGVTISGGDTHRIFGVLSTGSLTLQNLTLADGKAKGGNGGNGTFGYDGAGGGGAAGMGCHFQRGHPRVAELNVEREHGAWWQRRDLHTSGNCRHTFRRRRRTGW